MTIHIEISNEGHNKEKPWRIRIGDIDGSIGTSNITRAEVIEEVVDAIATLEQKTRKSGDKHGN